MLSRKQRGFKKELGGRTTVHHIIPRSRGGMDHPQNLVELDKRFHMNFHRVFGNLTPNEIHVFLIIVLGLNETQWTWERICQLREGIKTLSDRGYNVLAMLQALGGNRGD